MVGEGVSLELYCLSVGCLSMFLQNCYEPTGIFRRYYVLLVYLWIKWRRKKQRKYRPILSPLGLCPQCQNFWINTILYPIFFGLTPEYILSVGGTYIVVELIIIIKRK